MLHRLARYAYGGVFNADEVRILTAAFDEAWNSVQENGGSLGTNGQAAATREFLALRIIQAARRGMRDRHRLRVCVCGHLASYQSAGGVSHHLFTRAQQHLSDEQKYVAGLGEGSPEGAEQ